MFFIIFCGIIYLFNNLFFHQLLLPLFCTAVIILDAWFFPVPVALLLRIAIATMGGAIFFFLSSISIVLDYRNRY